MSEHANDTTSFTHAFDAFVNNYIEHSTAKNKGLITYYDEQWASPCLQVDLNKTLRDDEEVTWKPFLRDPNESLDNLEEALVITIPKDLKNLFCRYYSHDLNAQTENGKLTILQVWNEEDFDRLQKNLIAHVLMKRRLKQDDTLFFALTDEDGFILSIMLSTGAVMLEQVGKVPQREIASSLTEFMSQLTPAPVLVSL